MKDYSENETGMAGMTDMQNMADLQDMADQQDMTHSSDDRLAFNIRRALLEDAPEPDTRKAFAAFKRRNGLDEHTHKTILLPRRGDTSPPTMWISIASLVAAACVAAFVFLFPWAKNETRQSVDPYLAKMGNVVYEASTDNRQYISISFGDETMPLNQASASKVVTFDVERDEVQLYNTAPDDHGPITIEVPHGKMLTVLLDDSTRIVLNACSRLTFPRHFEKEGNREVELQGEAYFEVKHDAAHPFIVKSGDMLTTDLGTKFVVRAYAGEPHSVTLEEGSVDVTDGNQRAILKPEQVVQVSTDKTMTLGYADMERTLSWTHGEFYYDGQTLRELLTDLGRWYHLNVVFASDSHIAEQLHFSADRSLSVDEVVHQLSLICHAKLSLQAKERVLLVK